MHSKRIRFFLFYLLYSLFSHFSIGFATNCFAQEVVWSNDFEDIQNNTIPDYWQRVISKNFSSFGKIIYPAKEIIKKGNTRLTNTSMQLTIQGKDIAIESTKEISLSYLYTYKIRAKIKSEQLSNNHNYVKLIIFDIASKPIQEFTTSRVIGSTNGKWVEVVSLPIDVSDKASYGVIQLISEGGDLSGSVAFDDLIVVKEPRIELNFENASGGIIKEGSKIILNLSFTGLDSKTIYGAFLKVEDIYGHCLYKKRLTIIPDKDNKRVRKKLSLGFLPTGIYQVLLDIKSTSSQVSNKISKRTYLYVISKNLPSVRELFTNLIVGFDVDEILTGNDFSKILPFINIVKIKVFLSQKGLDDINRFQEMFPEVDVFLNIIPCRERVTYEKPIPSLLYDFTIFKTPYQKKLSKFINALKGFKNIFYVQLGDDADYSLWNVRKINYFLGDFYKLFGTRYTVIIPTHLSLSNINILQSKTFSPLINIVEAQNYKDINKLMLFTRNKVVPFFIKLPYQQTIDMNSYSNLLKNLLFLVAPTDYTLVDFSYSENNELKLFDYFSALNPNIYIFLHITNDVLRDAVLLKRGIINKNIHISLYTKTEGKGEKRFICAFWSDTKQSFNLPASEIIRYVDFLGYPHKVKDALFEGKPPKNSVYLLQSDRIPKFVEFKGIDPLLYEGVIKSVKLNPEIIKSISDIQNTSIEITNFFDNEISIDNVSLQAPKDWKISLSKNNITIKPGESGKIPIEVEIPVSETLGKKTIYLRFSFSLAKNTYTIGKKLFLTVKSDIIVKHTEKLFEDKGFVSISMIIKNIGETAGIFKFTASVKGRMIPVDFVIGPIAPKEVSNFSIPIKSADIGENKQITLTISEVNGKRFVNIIIPSPKFSPPFF